ncbi:hypothetical protein Mapa_007935 [Marchantia paleacea]|nr:hypothetical protein Mapa_007935 [Marchantia paleacea]
MIPKGQLMTKLQRIWRNSGRSEDSHLLEDVACVLFALLGLVLGDQTGISGLSACRVGGVSSLPLSIARGRLMLLLRCIMQFALRVGSLGPEVEVVFGCHFSQLSNLQSSKVQCT